MEIKSQQLKETEKVKKIIETSEIKNVEVKKETNTKPTTIDERILSFLRSRNSNDFTEINEFVKTLYPSPVLGANPAWMSQGISKKIRTILENMQEKGEIVIQNDQHKKLGTFFYIKENPITQYYNIGKVAIKAKIF